MNLNILDISPYRISALMNTVLSKGIRVEKLFQESLFRFVIDCDGITAEEKETLYSNLVFRLFWEASVLNRHKSNRSTIYENKIHLIVSLSEVIDYISIATPPALRHMIPDSIKSVNSIIEVLNQFLRDYNYGQRITYESIFMNYMKFCDLSEQRPFNHDLRKIRKIKESVNHDITAVVYVSDKSFEYIMKEDTYTDSLYIMNCKNDKGLETLLDIVKRNALEIHDVCRVPNEGTYVVAFHPTKKYDERIHEILKYSYEPFMK